MSSKTKIVVLRMKELIYTGIFVALGILLILLLVYMFAPKGKKSPGICRCCIHPRRLHLVHHLGGNAVDVAVTVSETRIESIAYHNLSEAIETMYPLMQPALDNLAEQICETQSLEGLDYSEDTQYTSQVILGAVERALEKAAAPQADDTP